MSTLSPAILAAQVAQCTREITRCEREVRNGERGIAGIVLGLVNWSAERRILLSQLRQIEQDQWSRGLGIDWSPEIKKLL